MTNNPRSVETAAWSLACKWWDSSPKSSTEKSQALIDAAEKVGKPTLVPEVESLLGLTHQNGRTEWESTELNNNTENISLGVIDIKQESDKEKDSRTSNVHIVNGESRNIY